MNYLILIIYNVLRIYQIMIFAYVLMSWFPNFRSTPVARFLFRACDPYISKFRRIIPPIGGLDFSPIIGFLLIDFAVRGFYSLLV